jgi:glucosylceramidase
MKRITIAAALIAILFSADTQAQSVSWWLTTSDKAALLTRQSHPYLLTALSDADKADTMAIHIDASRQYQSVDGFGFALTGGSARHISRMTPSRRDALLQDLFGKDNGIGISYLRISIGSSDLNDHTFSYDDLAPGETDMTLKHFSLKEDEQELIPVLKRILAIQPGIKVLASPWSAPVWMKTNGKIQGGRLKEMYYSVYAGYLVRYIGEMRDKGITIDAVTLQNEPFNDGNTPSMQMFAKEQARFIRDHLGPKFRAAGIATRIILYDHNCDAPEYPVSILTDTAANPYIDGSGFHLYAGPITAMSKVHDAFPMKNLYFTEMMAVNRNGDFNIAYPVDRILIGATRNWSRNVILWNLAADPAFQPHTDNGGCAMCQGAVTIDGDSVTRNIAYYTIGHAARFVPPGAVRIESTLRGALSNVAFRTPEGRIVLIVANKGKANEKFTIIYNDQAIHPVLDAGAVATYVWGGSL